MMATRIDGDLTYVGYNGDCAAAEQFASDGKFFAANLVHAKIAGKLGDGHPRAAYHFDLAGHYRAKALAAHKRRERSAKSRPR
jgi:hypothetical protein